MNREIGPKSSASCLTSEAVGTREEELSPCKEEEEESETTTLTFLAFLEEGPFEDCPSEDRVLLAIVGFNGMECLEESTFFLEIFDGDGDFEVEEDLVEALGNRILGAIFSKKREVKINGVKIKIRMVKVREKKIKKEKESDG